MDTMSLLHLTSEVSSEDTVNRSRLRQPVRCKRVYPSAFEVGPRHLVHQVS